MMRVTLAILLGVALCGSAACGRKKAGAPNQAGGEVKRLRIYCWPDYIPQRILNRFTLETGIRVNIDNYTSHDEMIANVRSQQAAYDLIQPGEAALDALVRHELLLPLDKANIPNLKNIAPEFRGLPQDPENQFSAPWMAGTLGIVVNTERVAEPIAGFREVFTPQFAGRILVVEDARELLSIALVSLGQSINEVTEETLEQARGVLDEWMKLVKVFESTNAGTRILNGDADIGVLWSPEAALLVAANPKFKWILPNEGTHRFVDSLAIPKTAANKANAETFIDFILRPEISRMLSEEVPGTNPNLAAQGLLSPEERSNPASYGPAAGSVRIETFRDIGAARADVERLVAQARGLEEATPMTASDTPPDDDPAPAMKKDAPPVD